MDLFRTDAEESTSPLNLSRRRIIIEDEVIIVKEVDHDPAHGHAQESQRLRATVMWTPMNWRRCDDRAGFHFTLLFGAAAWIPNRCLTVAG